MSISMQFLFNTIRFFSPANLGLEKFMMDLIWMNLGGIQSPDLYPHLWIRWPLLDLMLLDILLKHSEVCVAVQVCPKIGAAIPVYGNSYENYDQP